VLKETRPSGLSPAADHIVGGSPHSLRQSKQVVLAYPVLQRVRKLPQLDGAVAQFFKEPRLNGEHDLLPQVGRIKSPTIRLKKCTQSSRLSAIDLGGFLQDFDMPFTPPSGSGSWLCLAGVGLSKQTAFVTQLGPIRHGTAMTSPR
jgi:hypothetical protein